MTIKPRHQQEKYIEMKLREETRKRGGMAIKLTSPNLTGIPDRLLLFPNRKVAFVEVKTKGQKPRPRQVKVMNDIGALGFPCVVLDDAQDINLLLDELC